jgi:hypothetical protein
MYNMRGDTWTPDEIRILVEGYADRFTSTDDIANQLRRRGNQVRLKASKLGLKKVTHIDAIQRRIDSLKPGQIGGLTP